MAKRILGLIIGLDLGSFALCPDGYSGRSISLSLEDCIVKAMKNNLGVAVEVLNPELRISRYHRLKKNGFRF